MIEWSKLDVRIGGSAVDWLQKRPVYCVDCTCEILLAALLESLRESVLYLICDASACVSDVDFFAACKKDLRFPNHFGMNWHAFNDCVREFDFLPEKNIVIGFCGFRHFASANPQGAANAIEICGNGKRYSDKGVAYFFCAR